MSYAHENHFTGTIEQIVDEDDETISLIIRHAHETRRIQDTRRPMAAFLVRWADAGCPKVHINSQGHLSLAKQA